MPCGPAFWQVGHIAHTSFGHNLLNWLSLSRDSIGHGIFYESPRSRLALSVSSSTIMVFYGITFS
jgi:hypothetical protein